MQNKRYFHVRIHLNEPSIFDKPQFEIGDSFENNLCNRFRDTSTVPYDLIDNSAIINKEKGFFKFLDEISESENIIDFNNSELKKKVIDTININCLFLNARYWENIFEEVRQKEFKNLPSRKKCIYVCEGIEELMVWYKKLIDESKSENAIIYELKLDEERVFKCDANILEMDILTDSQFEDKAWEYWSGKRTDNPLIENLYTGKVQILNEYSSVEEISKTDQNSLIK